MMMKGNTVNPGRVTVQYVLCNHLKIGGDANANGILVCNMNI